MSYFDSVHTNLHVFEMLITISLYKGIKIFKRNNDTESWFSVLYKCDSQQIGKIIA